MTDRIKQKIEDFARAQMAEVKDPGHNIEHVERVYSMAVRLSEGLDVDLDVIRAAVLLHDIGGSLELADKTGGTDHAVESARIARPFLESLDFSKQQIEHICDCIISHRYRTGNKPRTKEAEIVFDADKLDTVGAIGISRMMVWMGRNDAHIYNNPDVNEYATENLGGNIKGRIHDKSKHSPQMQWETKDKFILDFLHTDKAKVIAKGRMEFSEMSLAKLEREIQGLE